MKYTEQFKKSRFTKEDYWLSDNLLYECVMGSQAYGLSTKESDVDVVGLVMDREDCLFPQKFGYIRNFETEPNFHQKEIKGPGKKLIINDIETEIEWNSLTRFFYLAGIKGSPNLIEILFVRRNLVTYSHNIGWMLRDNRHKFISMRTFNALKGYAYQQLMRIKRGVNRGTAETPKRQEYLDKFGYDIKMSYHPLRLLDQLNQLLDEGDMDLMRNKDECRVMRKGEWGTFEQFEKVVTERLNLLENKALSQNALSNKPRSGELKILLQSCIEEWYGSDSEAKKNSEYVSAEMVFEELKKISNKLGA